MKLGAHSGKKCGISASSIYSKFIKEIFNFACLFKPTTQYNFLIATNMVIRDPERAQDEFGLTKVRY